MRKAKAQSAHASGEGIIANSRKLPTQLLTDVSSDMEVMQQEIFGIAAHHQLSTLR